MSEVATGNGPKTVVALDGTCGSVERQARALAGFLRGGVHGDVCVETWVFCDDVCAGERLALLAPTGDVRLAEMPATRPDVMAAVLAEALPAHGVELLLLAGGATGTEVATRVALRTGGGALTDVLDVEPGSEVAVCRRDVYSGHMRGRFALTARPWCLSIDSSWQDALVAPALEHRVLGVVDAVAGTGPSFLEDVELAAPAPDTGIADSRFLVVAGRGVGSSQRVRRVEAAARRMGAAFGVTRPVAMNAWAPMDRLVGISGARAAPALCLVVGASGAPAFYWGIERSDRIVAVDPDEHAPIAAAADAVVRDDGVAVVEALAEIVTRRRSKGRRTT